MTRAIVPDILSIYPVNSLVMWKWNPWQKDVPNYVPARVVGKVDRQGNGRISIDVLYVGSNATGENVLYVKRMTSVGVKHVCSLAQWWAMRHD